jgi:hypothetical protein
MAYLLRLASGVLFSLTLAMLWTPAHAGGWRYLATDPCGTAAAGAVNMLAAYRRIENGVRYDYVLTATNEATGRLDGTRSETTLSTGVTVDKGVWGYVLLSCTSANDTVCNDLALVDSTAFGSRDIQVPGKVSSGEVCMPSPGVPSGSGCKVTFKRDASYQLNNGSWVSEGTYSRPTGQGSCVTAAAAVPATADTCKNGQPGTVNGVAVCIPFSGQTPTVTDTKKDTSTVTPGGTETTSESKTTECANGKCTTTNVTNTTNTSGVTTTTTNVTTETQGEHCAANPGAVECKGDSSFSGDCAAGFTFEGDAIQGAMAKEIHNQNCLINAPSDESALYTTKKSEASGDLTASLPGNQTVTVGSGDFDSSDAIGGAACISNKTVVVWGKTVVLPFSDVCPALGYLNTILLAISWMTAAGIVIGRKT